MVNGYRILVATGLTGALAFLSGCPASNPCDPSAGADTRAPGLVKAQVRVKLGADAVAPDAIEGFDVDRLKVSIDEGAPESLPTSGDIALELEPGSHTISIFDSALEDNLGARTFAAVRVGACLEQSLGTVEFVDRTAPSPVLIEPLAEATRSTTVDVVLATPSVDTAGNLADYQIALNDGAFSVLADFSEAGDIHAVDLVPNSLNLIRLRAMDAVGNASAEVVHTVVHDDTPPDVSAAYVAAEAGSARVDLRFGLADPGLDPQARGDVAGFKIHYGPEPNALFGTSANEGASPVTVLDPGADAFRLSGLVNGNPVYVQVEVFDALNNAAPLAEPIGVLPNDVTPETRANVALTEAGPTSDEDATFYGATATVSDGSFLYAVVDEGATRTVKVVDLRESANLPEAFTLNAALTNVTDIALAGRLLVVTRGTAGITVYDVTDPRAPVSLASPPITDLTGCDGGDCRAVSVTTRDGEAWIAVSRYPEDADLANDTVVAGLAGLERGLWQLDVKDPGSIATLGDLKVLDLTDDDGRPADLKGPMKLFGRYLAIGERYVRPTPLYGEVNVPDAVLVVDVGGTVPTACTRFAPTSDNKFNEILSATGQDAAELENPNLIHFDVAGDYLFAAYGGDVVMLDMNAGTTLGQDCSNAAGVGNIRVKTSATNVVGSYSVGLRRPRAVTVAGGFMYVASQRAYVELEAPPRIDVVAIENRQEVAGAANGIPNAFSHVGQVDMSEHGVGPLLADGPHLLSAGRDATRIEVFSARAPQLVAAANENPTGMNVGMGPYIVHQRTERGIGVWDVSRPEVPQLVNGSTCFPGCFDEQALAGDAFIDGGYLYSAFKNAQPAPIFFSVVDVATTPEAPLTERTSVTNPCGNSDVRGMARDGHHLFVGCEGSTEVHVVDLSSDTLDEVVARALPDDILQNAVRDIAITRMDVGDEVKNVLVVLDAQGNLYFFDADARDAPPTLIDELEVVSLGFDYASRLRVAQNRALVLGGLAPDGCDPVIAAGCPVTDNKVGIVALDAAGSGPLNVTVAGAAEGYLSTGEREQLIRVYGDLLMLTRDDGLANPYYFYDVSSGTESAVLELMGVAQPNASPLEGTIHGGHLFGASFNIFALE